MYNASILILCAIHIQCDISHLGHQSPEKASGFAQLIAAFVAVKTPVTRRSTFSAAPYSNQIVFASSDN